MSLKQEFNERSQTIQTLERKTSKTVKEVNEFQDTLTAITEEEESISEVFQGSYALPMKPCIVKGIELPSKQPSVLGFLASSNQFSILSENEAIDLEPGQEQSLEDPSTTRAQ